MTAQSRIAPGALEASLHFLRPMDGRPVAYQYDPPPGIPARTGTYDAHAVTICDARPLGPFLSLDEEGFRLIRAPSAVEDFDDEQAIATRYYPEVERHIAEATGAELVIGFDHNVRNAARAAQAEPGIRWPVPRAHNDFTLRSGPDRARRELALRGLDPDTLLRRRFAIVNLWRPIGRPVERSPLALCDARTIQPGDLVAADLVYRDRTGETYALQHDPAQDWYYFPRLTPDEAILIKGFDSCPDVARFTAHGAFEDPSSRPDAPERESIEARALAIWPD